MDRLALLLILLATGGRALAYSGVADVTFSWGETSNPVSWSWRLQNSLATMSNDVLFTSLAGSNQVSYFNSDFATTAACNAAVAGVDGSATAIVARKHGCRYQTGGGNPAFLRLPSPATDAGPAGAQATGTLNFTDDTLTGELAVTQSTDEPTGGTATSVGDGASGFNIRAEDTSVYGNVWYGVSNGARLIVDLRGTFTAAGWEITGGTVRLADPGFQCQQGGIGGAAPSFVLCAAASTVPGSYSADGSHLSFGVDLDGAGAGVAMGEIEVWDTTASSVLARLSGVLATLTVGPTGGLATSAGEFRSGRGDGDLCASKLRWDSVGLRLTCGTLTVGALQITGTATPVDTEPDPFTFAAADNVALATLVTSGAATITGIAAPARITVSGGQYSVGCTGTFTAAAGNVPDGSAVCVRHSSAALPGTSTVTTLNVGGVIGTFTSTTLPADTTPDPFSFTDQTGVAVSTPVVSGPVTITGINGAAPVSVTGGEYSVGCSGLFTDAPGSVGPAQTVCVRHLSAAGFLTATVTTLSVGGVTGTFSSTTAAPPPDTTPEAFAFADRTGVALSAVVTSAPVTITGISAPAAVSVAGGTYAVGCAEPFGSTPGTVTGGQVVCVRHTSPATNGAATNTTLTVGGISDTFTSTTVGAGPTDSTPDAFVLADQGGVALSTPVTSAPVTINGIDTMAPVSVTGGEYSVGCTGSFTSAPGSITVNQTVCVRHSSAAASGTTTATALTIGGVSATFTSTTLAASGGGGGGGGAVDGWLLSLLAGLTALRRRRPAAASRRLRA